jgi:WD40 repeat protein
MMIETGSDADAAVAAKHPGDELRLLVHSGGSEHRVRVTLAEQPKIQAAQDRLPLLMLDTGGHMAIIKSLSFTPNGKQLVSAGDDKVISVWDWQAAKTIRTIRGQVARGPDGKIFAMALSPDGHWLAAGGWMNSECQGRCGDIRLYDFTSGKLIALLKWHTNTVLGLAFSPDAKQLISGSFDHSVIIWDVEGRKQLHLLRGHTDQISGVVFTPDGQRVVSSSYDTRLRLWRVSDGGLIAELKGHTQSI